MAGEKTVVYNGSGRTTKVILTLLARTRQSIDILASSAGPSVLVGLEPIRQASTEMVVKGARVRFLTEITRENISHCREIMKIGEVRHLDNIKGGMALNEKEYISASTIIAGKPVPQIIYSNVGDFVEQQRYLFDTLWGIARPGRQRIAEIEQGRHPEFMELITDPSSASKTFARLIQSADKKVSLLLPNTAAFGKAYDAGVLDALVDKAEKKKVEVRIICPLEGADGKLVSTVASKIRLLSGHESAMSLLIVDDDRCFVVEEREPGNQFSGFILHTNSPPAVRSFRSLFDIQWRELSLIDSLQQVGRQREEFISVAAHELRNPITPIMLFVDGLKEEFGDRPEITGIVRNTKRLQRLLQDILDVAKVENKNLAIKKVQVDLNQLLKEACADAQGQARGKDARVVFEPGIGITAMADPARISQVIYNLLDNALKFTEKGAITVSARAGPKRVEVSIRDGGPGIDNEIMPRLFTKFASKSDKGTGLGLYLCKAIVEAHGGRIWAENNKDDNGATFTFTLPLAVT
jgi:signal transduction histidine kinase